MQVSDFDLMTATTLRDLVTDRGLHRRVRLSHAAPTRQVLDRAGRLAVASPAIRVARRAARTPLGRSRRAAK